MENTEKCEKRKKKKTAHILKVPINLPFNYTELKKNGKGKWTAKF